MKVLPDLAARHATPDWVHDDATPAGLGETLATLRRGAPLVAVSVGICLLLAALYAGGAPKRYEASVDLLVAAPDRDSAVAGVGLVTSSTDPTRNVQTVSRLATAPDVAERVAREVSWRTTAAAIRSSLRATPVADSDIVTLSVRASTPRRARALAIAYGDAVVAQRSARLHDDLDEVLPRLRTQLEQTSDPDLRAELSARLAELSSLREGRDPSVRRVTTPELPTSAVSPRTTLAVAAALVIGLLLGAGAAFALQAINPRVLTEQHLRAAYRLPVLARLRRPGVRSARRSRRSEEAAALAVLGDLVTQGDARLGRPAWWVMTSESGESARHLAQVVGGLSDRIVVTGVDEGDGDDIASPAISPASAADGRIVSASFARLRELAATIDEATEVILVVDLGRTRVEALQGVARDLRDHGVRPAGFALVA